MCPEVIIMNRSHAMWKQERGTYQHLRAVGMQSSLLSVVSTETREKVDKGLGEETREEVTPNFLVRVDD